MEIYKTIMEIISKPDSIAGYRNLKNLYTACSMDTEAQAIGHLIEQRSWKNAEIINNDSDDHQE